MNNQENLRDSVVGNLIWKFAERVLTQGVSFVVSVVLARLLMPEDYGIIALVNVFINLAAVFVNTGFSTALIQKKDADSTDFSTMFFCSLACSVLIYAVLFLAAPFVASFYQTEEITAILRVFALLIPFGVYNSIQQAYVSRHMLFRRVFVSSAISAAVSGLVGIVMAVQGFGVWALVAQSLTAMLTNSFVLAVLLPWHPQLKFSASAAKQMMKYGSHVLGADLSGTFFAEIRSLIIGRFYTSADLAFYNKGYHLPNLITSNLSSTIMAVMFPAIANHSDNLAQVKAMARRIMRILSYVLVPCLFGLASVMEPLILLLYTDKWAQVIPFGQVLSISLAIGVFGIIPLQVLKAIGRSDVVLGLEIWKKPMYLLLLIIGVNISVFGIAVTMLIYDFYGAYVNMLQMRKFIHYSLREQMLDLLPAFLLGAVMVAAVLLTPNVGGLILTLVVKVLVGITVYVAGSAICRVESFVYLINILLDKFRKKSA